MKTAPFAAMAAGLACLCLPVLGQDPPPVAMRMADLRRDLIEHATVVVKPGQRIEDGAILLENGWITAVGKAGEVKAPAGTTVHDAKGRTLYPGLIDAGLVVDSDAAARSLGDDASAHWNRKVTPQLRVADLPVVPSGTRKELRDMGFAMAAVHPNTGIFRGASAVLLLAEEDRKAEAIVPDAGQTVAFAHVGDYGAEDSKYPGALMGAIALVRQTLLDAQWQKGCVAAWQAAPQGKDPPQASAALAALQPAVDGSRVVVFDVPNEQELLRAARVAREFNLKSRMLGSGMEFRRLAEVKASGSPVVVPLEFPKTPEVADPRADDGVSLRELATWALAPRNLKQLLDAGVDASVGTHRLKNRGDFPARARRVMREGLSEDELLGCLTVRPAAQLGLGAITGTLEPGRMANLVMTDGPLFDEKTHVLSTWVAGTPSEVFRPVQFAFSGPFALKADGVELTGSIDPQAKTITLERQPPAPPPTPVVPSPDGKVEAPPAAKLPDPLKFAAERVNFDLDKVAFTLKGDAFGLPGLLRCTAVVVGDEVRGTAETGEGRSIAFTLVRATPTADAKPAEPAKPEPAKSEDPLAFVPRTVPLGEYGFEQPPQRQDVLVRNATVWTCGPQGRLAGADLLVVDGKVKAVGKGLQAPAGATVIDAAGKHVTPGLIDCHSHTGIHGGVNEWTKNDTAECRVGDCIDPDASGWYRELAGGLTVANQLHGSANPIGGQNSVVKLKWGGSADDFRFPGAIGGIKFALGENVTRPRGRYPNTRMGVEALLRDSFRAARAYAAERAAFDALPADARARTMPPRRDLQLDALAEILGGQRLVHCHSYRQDEILMLLRLADDFGFTVGTLQHVLEGYKVADEIARHGAGASSFSDWWAYKMEVMDAVPTNGSLMRDVGVLVSFNSDSDEMARRMNMEAAKAVKYGDCPPEEALKFVTLNPAKQLRIDDRVGSLEPGKDGDFVIWSGDPLSSFSLAESTWIEGTCLFDRARALAMRERDMKARARLIELAVLEGEKAGALKAPEAPGEAKPVEAKPTLLSRMLDVRRAALLDEVARGRDPMSIGPGDCGCGGSAEGWKIMLEASR
jgi:N-acetylglucosamine-6-phosphate deacetylase